MRAPLGVAVTLEPPAVLGCRLPPWLVLLDSIPLSGQAPYHNRLALSFQSRVAARLVQRQQPIRASATPPPVLQCWGTLHPNRGPSHPNCSSTLVLEVKKQWQWQCRDAKAMGSPTCSHLTVSPTSLSSMSWSSPGSFSTQSSNSSQWKYASTASCTSVGSTLKSLGTIDALISPLG